MGVEMAQVIMAWLASSFCILVMLKIFHEEGYL